jgi:hypothetical protein
MKLQGKILTKAGENKDPSPSNPRRRGHRREKEEGPLHGGARAVRGVDKLRGRKKKSPFTRVHPGTI